MRSTLRFLSRLGRSEHLSLILVGVAIGVVVGLFAVGFTELIALVREATPLPAEGAGFSETVAGVPWYWILIVPAVGGLLIGPIVFLFAKEARGHGVPEVMEAMILRRGRIRPRVVLAKVVASALTIGTGGSVGREGPMIQVGSAVGSVGGQMFGMSDRRIRTLLAAGAAAGIAATFNAPIAGVLFAVEIILGEMEIRSFSPIIIAAVIATVVGHGIYGNVPLLEAEASYRFVSPWELPIYAVLGILSAGAALLFIEVLHRSEQLFENRIRIPGWLKPAIGGLLLGGVALLAPQVLGVGYEAMEGAIRGEMVLSVLLLLVLLKVLATSFSLGSGASGGVFAPSLFMGAMVGGAVGFVAHALFPSVTAPVGAYALVGMGGVVAGATHAPMTAILILYEMTRDYQIILPLMITCILASLIARNVRGDSIYTIKLSQRGLMVRQGREVGVLRTLRVQDAMEKDFEVFPESLSYRELLSAMVASEHQVFPVTATDGDYHGGIVLDDCKAVLLEPGLEDVVVARDLARDELPVLTPEANLEQALDVFDTTGLAEIPVVEGDRLVGLIRERDALAIYKKSLLTREME
jgi:CIC family chloride channel protein